MNITLSSFGGIVPRTSPHSLTITHATVAHDVRLRNGRLEPWKDRCTFMNVGSGKQSFHLHGHIAIAWDTVVQAAEVSPDWKRTYITGHASYPEVVTFSCDGTPTYYRLGVPTPETAPSASGAESCTRASDARSYVYTYINEWGEESAPSPASNIITVADSAPVRLTNIAIPPAGYNIVGINIYRCVTGFRPPDVKQQTPLTDYMYLTTISPLSSSYTDSMALKSVGPVLETQKVHMPPEGLQNIVSIDGIVRLAGTVANRVYLTENFQLHNWPVKYQLTLDSTIVHMRALDRKLFVTTHTTPYIIDVSSCEDIKCIPVTDLGIPLPDISCSYAHAAIITQHGLIYSSPIGLILLGPDAKYYVLTKKWFSPEDWAKVMPDTVRLGYYQGFLFCITDRVSFIINIDGVTYGDMKESELVTISDKPIDLLRSNTGLLYMLENDTLDVWDNGLSYRAFTWESRELTGRGDTTGRKIVGDSDAPIGTSWSPASVKIRSKDTAFTLLLPNGKEAYHKKVVSERAFRLPRVGRHLYYKIRLSGIYPVEFLAMGTANFTVHNGV